MFTSIIAIIAVIGDICSILGFVYTILIIVHKRRRMR